MMEKDRRKTPAGMEEKGALRREDVLATDSDYRISLTKLTGLPVKDVLGFVSDLNGTPTFVLSRVVLNDGSELIVSGEHDHPYIGPEDKVPNLDEETLRRLGEEEG